MNAQLDVSQFTVLGFVGRAGVGEYGKIKREIFFHPVDLISTATCTLPFQSLDTCLLCLLSGSLQAAFR